MFGKVQKSVTPGVRLKNLTVSISGQQTEAREFADHCHILPFTSLHIICHNCLILTASNYR